MFDKLQALPADPILGLMMLHHQDTNPDKIDVGIGVYKDELGQTPILPSVKEAENRYFGIEQTKSYIGPAGATGFNTSIQALIFGAQHAALADGRVVTMQTPGGCGALRVAAELLKRCEKDMTVWVSDPTWANHIPLLGSAGLQIKKYRYYDYEQHGIDFGGMMADLQQAKAGDIVLLHGCCHNPSGADLDQTQWKAVADLALVSGFTPFIDFAYQGFGSGLDEDAYGIRLLADTVPELIVTSSCSKNFGIYRERVGALSILVKDSSQAATVQSQAFDTARGIYSMPPSHGGALVELILNTPDLHQQWLTELDEMRDRLNGLRKLIVERFNQKGAGGRFDFIQREWGMFSFLGISAQQVERLQKEYSIYMVDSSRFNVAGISQKNVDYFTDSVMAVL